MTKEFWKIDICKTEEININQMFKSNNKDNKIVKAMIENQHGNLIIIKFYIRQNFWYFKHKNFIICFTCIGQTK